MCRFLRVSGRFTGATQLLQIVKEHSPTHNDIPIYYWYKQVFFVREFPRTGASCHSGAWRHPCFGQLARKIIAQRIETR
jgi:hypothetical protein